ncbi:MAG: hypothetical protein QNJ61_07125 [Desulfobacterales bacterium]|nr:hypothetical protein [Desulfobacterales bacterium]
MNFIKNYLITIIGLLGTLFFFATMTLEISRGASGIDGLLFWASRLAGMVVILPSQLLIVLNDGELMPYHRTLSAGIGWGGCLVLDLIKNKLRHQK